MFSNATSQLHIGLHHAIHSHNYEGDVNPDYIRVWARTRANGIIFKLGIPRLTKGFSTNWHCTAFASSNCSQHTYKTLYPTNYTCQTAVNKLHVLAPPHGAQSASSKSQWDTHHSFVAHPYFLYSKSVCVWKDFCGYILEMLDARSFQREMAMSFFLFYPYVTPWKLIHHSISFCLWKIYYIVLHFIDFFLIFWKY